MSKYRRIRYEDRCQIYALSKRGASQESIASVLGVSQSAVSREMRRNRGQRGYRFKQAEAKAQARQAIRSKPRKLTAPMRSKIEAKLRQMRWSPEQISGWLSAQGIQLSHERIYQMIWDDKRDGGDLWRSLRRCGKRYNKRAGKNAGRGLIPNRIDISKRPAIVARKTRLGDWEGDTVVSAGHKGGLLTLVERKTQLTKIIKLPRDRPRNTKRSRASPQAYRQLRAHHHLRQWKGIRRASGHRLCTESQNLLCRIWHWRSSAARCQASRARRKQEHRAKGSSFGAFLPPGGARRYSRRRSGGHSANRAALKKRRARAVPHISARLNIDAHREQVSAARVFRRAVPPIACTAALTSIATRNGTKWLDLHGLAARVCSNWHLGFSIEVE